MTTEENILEEKVIQPKKNFIVKHYLISSITIVYILTVLAHILGVNISISLSYLGNISFFIAIVFIMYVSIKNELNAKLGKKVLSAIVSFVIGVFLLNAAQRLAIGTILAAQDLYVEKAEAAWSKELKVFATENDLTSLTDKEIEGYVTQEYYDNFAAKFNDNNKLTYMFMIKNKD